MAAQAGFQQDFPSTIDVPLVGAPLQRAAGTGDQRSVNVLYEVHKNPITGSSTIYAVKRPGLANSTQPSGGAATGRGLYAWGATGKIYSVFNNKIYSGTTDLSMTLAASTGRCWFTETAAGSSAQILVISDGTDNYHITTSDAVTQIDEADDGQYPTSNLGPVCFFDDYIYQAKSNGQIWNTEPDAFTSWLSTNFKSAQMYGDSLEAIARLKTMIVAFGTASTEFFFDNGTVNSPLLRIPANAMQLGMATKNSLAQAGDTLVWVAEAPAIGDGGRQVWAIEASTKGTRISTPIIERFLNAEGTSMSSCTAWMESVAGHLIYVLNLSSASRTFVYDFTSLSWTEWSAITAVKFTGIAATSLNGVVYVQDAANGRIYTLSPATYQDSGSNFTVTLQTDKSDFGTPMAKFQHGLWLMGDNTTGTINVSEADDDYTNFNAARTIDMTATRKYLGMGGMFFQRAYKLEYTQNAALRLEKLTLGIDVGNG
jgi:hypothetical protein